MPEIEEFEIGAEVLGTDGACGTLSRVVFDPVAQELTHLLVQPRHGHELARLVPVGLVESAAHEIRLSCTTAQFARLDPGEETQFIAGDLDTPNYRPGDSVFWPHYGFRGARGDLVTSDAIPVGEVEVRRGEHLHATDGSIGRVEGLVVDPQSHHVTHVLVQEGHLLGHREVAIPIAAVTRVEDSIEVNLTRREIQDLPPVDIEHPAGARRP